MRFRGIGQVSLRVRDVERASVFYHGFLGLDQTSSEWTNPRKRVYRAGHPLNEDGFCVVLTEDLPADASPGLNVMGLEIASAMDLFELYELAIQEGVEATEPDFGDGYWRTFLTDPDGYKVEIMTADTGGRIRPAVRR
jgi:catechol 2,3-dioxygenase-like lactoylglutathione lyase family enzyme